MTVSRDLADGAYDVVVIGGGMAGAGVARDLALRGLAVALVEKADFASGTTSRSSKLIHGGLRYLELFDWALVRESLRERETLRRLAPHLIRPLPFLVPIYRESSRSLIKVRIGLKLYDLLTPGRDRDRYRVLRPVDALSLESQIRAAGLGVPATTSTICCSFRSGSVWRTSSPPAVTARARSTMPTSKKSSATRAAPSPASRSATS